MGCCSSGLQHFNDQDFSSIVSEQRDTGQLWEDDKFRPSNYLLPSGLGNIVWKRPKDICANLRGKDRELYRDPVMGDRNRKNINQGEIGDCWFLSALAALLEDKHLFERVVPSGQDFNDKYCGVFRFRFYRLGLWHEVVIDDRLPTRDNRLVFLSGGKPNEFWPALFEKAYAKFYGGYQNIVGGTSLEAGVDFTGGISERLNVSEYLKISGNGPEKLLHLLKLSRDNGALVSCNLGGHFVQEAVNQKLQNRHAYTITGITEVRAGKNGRLVIPLVRLRDPHGERITNEWSGDWGDDSKVWGEISTKVEKKLRTKSKDGEFYISYYKDFIRFFGDIDLIHLNPLRIELNEERQSRKFKLVVVEGEWVRGVAGATTGGRYRDFHMNPQYHFTISNCRDTNSTCMVVVSLTQKLENRKENKSSIGFKIYRNPSKDETLDQNFIQDPYNLQCDSGAFTDSRDVTGSFLLPAGSYCIIPGTFELHEHGEFHLRVFVDSRWRCTPPNGASMTTVRDYTASARAAQRCSSFWRTLLCCRCLCCCCCPTFSCTSCCQSSDHNSAEEYKLVSQN